VTSDAPEAPITFHIEYRAGVPCIVEDGGGVRPATTHEITLWDRVGRLEAELSSMSDKP
jgi:hypothetical protein